MSADDHDIYQPVEKVLAATTAMQAQVEVLRDLVFVVAEQLGISSVDGLSLPAWFQREKLARLEHILIRFEDRNPEVAAWLQELVDAKRDKSPSPEREE